MSPEVIIDKNITEKSDIYSLGMVLIEMITIEIPYLNIHAHFNNIKQKIKEGIKPSALDRITDDSVKRFILKLIDIDPNKRPSVSEILEDEFLKINQKEDNRKIKLIKLKKKKKKVDVKSEMDNNEKTMDVYNKKQLKDNSNKNAFLFKHDFEEIPYFEESLKKDKGYSCIGDVDLLNSNLIKNRDEFFNNEKSKVSSPNKHIHINVKDNDAISNKDSNMLFNVVTSSHEGIYTHHSDVCHTANTDYINNNPIYQNKMISTVFSGNKIQSDNKITINDDSIDKNLINDKKIKKIDSPVLLSKKPYQLNLDENHTTHNVHPYQIFDSNYNVHLKFMINQDNKLHEIQFTYNLLRDNIPDLMEEIQNEFNFSHDNLNHIYETLKKISIYSKFYKTSDILHDNSA